MTHFLASEESIKGIAALIILGTMGVFRGLKTFNEKRKIEDTACSKIVSAPQGLVEVQGQAWPTGNLKCMDGRPVCYWDLRVQRYQKSGRNSSWVTVYHFQSPDPVIILDGSGACLVVPEKADIQALEKISYVQKISQDDRDQLTRALPEAAEYFSLAGHILGGLFSGNVRVVEKKILAGGPVYARGEFGTQFGSIAKAVGDYQGYQGQYQKINSPGYLARMFDANHDGRISDEEMINGHSFAASAFLRQGSQQDVAVCGHMYWSESHGLLIADAHQDYLLKRLDLASFVLLWGGALAFSLGIFLLFLKLTR
jgi:hypothetical protein